MAFNSLTYAVFGSNSSGGGGSITVPDAPTGLNATPINNTSFSLTWLWTAMTQSFRVYKNGLLLPTVYYTNRAVISGIIGTVYSLEVVAQNSGGNSLKSATTYFTMTFPRSKDEFLTTARSPLKEYYQDFVTLKDEQEVMKDSKDIWNGALTADCIHWKLDTDLSQRHETFDEWVIAIYGDPYPFKGRIEISPSEDLMKEIGTGRHFDCILTVHKALFDDRTLADTDVFSYKDQFYGISSITAENLYKEYETFVVFALFKRNTPELEAGINKNIIQP